MRSLIAGALVGTTAVVAAENEANPIRKIVNLLQDMQKEIEAEGGKEEDLYKKFMCYCKNNDGTLSKAAKDAAAEIEAKNAAVKAEKAEKASTAAELKQHKADRADAKEDLATASALRKKEADEYAAASKDQKFNIDSTNAALAALAKGGSGAFLQTTSAETLKQALSSVESIDSSDRAVVTAFLSGDYHAGGGQIVGILKNMKDEMDKALGGIISDEETAVKSFNDLKGAKTKEIDAASAAIEKKTERVGKLAVSIVQNQNAADDATREMGDAEKFAANLKASCSTKTEEYEGRKTVRTDELAAVSEAIKVLNDDDALDIFNKTNLAKTPSAPLPVAFLQRTDKKASVALKVREIVSGAEFKSHPALALIATTIAQKLKGQSVDFSSVVKMIDNMVALLIKESADDEKHRDYCNGEFDSSADEKKGQEGKIASLSAAIDQMKDEIATLTSDISNLNDENKALDKSVADATAQRKSENAEFVEASGLNKAAVQLMFKAKNRLNKFYNPAQFQEAPKREATAEERAIIAGGGSVDLSMKEQIAGTNQYALAQLPELEKEPETFGKTYGGKGQKANGVLSLMDMMIKDVEKDQQQAESDEKQSQKDYEELVADAQESRAQNVKSITDKEGSKAASESSMEEAKEGKITTEDALASTNSYIADLHQSCDFIIANFLVRREARTAEQTSLTNAKAILSGADYSF